MVSSVCTTVGSDTGSRTAVPGQPPSEGGKNTKETFLSVPCHSSSDRCLHRVTVRGHCTATMMWGALSECVQGYLSPSRKLFFIFCCALLHCSLLLCILTYHIEIFSYKLLKIGLTTLPQNRGRWNTPTTFLMPSNYTVWTRCSLK